MQLSVVCAFDSYKTGLGLAYDLSDHPLNNIRYNQVGSLVKLIIDIDYIFLGGQAGCYQ
ncbi:hypothetical protein ES703_113510 [subsurface metagenome]